MVSAVHPFVLEGGIKGWVQGGTDYISLMDGFVPSYWLEFTEAKAGSKRSVEDRALNEMAEDGNAAETFAKRRRDAPDDVAMG
jgi:hypothetical protein